ncbi:polyprenyl synthetase family protein [Periweissella beninensis]|uniref:Polyprenyl synthetase family protein n=1 Tax=Periweissella beninensis TaxID=504936 RepID=A0ABT0VHY6_9LACO|nr:farnesyl diphosphate synthase [Periweissella beninensis]MBM7544012.1 geranylgeranyl diphosphate synthase type II [Periweissella beninensis]MCM2437430.1 polyprenyl synthetase family protein [Periweissella beninensis]MCT4396521.1 polyprenyl synthetase family protein [Periweissella beninensis]
MDKTKYNSFIEQWQPIIEENLVLNINNSVTNAELQKIMIYAATAGGKRLRPLLTLAFYQAFGGTISDETVKVANALELIHTYSLIHDDLPAMDNDNYRRGKLTSHKKFGEANAILAGDAFLTLAFSWLTENDLKPELKVALISKLALAAGANGMVSGQILDMLGNNQQYTISQLKLVHRKKTGDLISYACIAGGILANVDDMTIDLLTKFGYDYGIAFQIKDDLLDDGDQVDTIKNTYPHLLGMQQAQIELKNTVKIARNLLIDLNKLNKKFDFQLIEGFLTYFERD